VTQRLQVNAHKAFEYIFQHPGPIKAPWQLKLAVRIPGVQHVVARVIGIGVRPEHIRSGKTRGSGGGRHDGRSLRRVAVVAGVIAGVTVSMIRMLFRTTART
jgi:hypothetical protein